MIPPHTKMKTHNQPLRTTEQVDMMKSRHNEDNFDVTKMSPQLLENILGTFGGISVITICNLKIPESQPSTHPTNSKFDDMYIIMDMITHDTC